MESTRRNTSVRRLTAVTDTIDHARRTHVRLNFRLHELQIRFFQWFHESRLNRLICYTTILLMITGILVIWVFVLKASITSLQGFSMLCVSSVLIGILGGLMVMSSWPHDWGQNENPNVYFGRRHRGVADEVKNSLKRITLQENAEDMHDLEKYLKEACTVCLGDFEIGETVTVLHCSHFYHDSCVDEWITHHHTCPICKDNLITAHLKSIQNAVDIESGIIAQSR